MYFKMMFRASSHRLFWRAMARTQRARMMVSKIMFKSNKKYRILPRLKTHGTTTPQTRQLSTTRNPTAISVKSK
jgi:hypothetical protein